MNRKSKHVDNRNYSKEAYELTKNLTKNQLHSLYEIVVNELKRSASEERLKELHSVQNAIRKNPKVEGGVLKKLETGYGEMASNARAKDGNTIKYQKKV
jgi:hypothetical protein